MHFKISHVLISNRNPIIIELQRYCFQHHHHRLGRREWTLDFFLTKFSTTATTTIWPSSSSVPTLVQSSSSRRPLVSNKILLVKIEYKGLYNDLIPFCSVISQYLIDFLSDRSRCDLLFHCSILDRFCFLEQSVNDVFVFASPFDFKHIDDVQYFDQNRSEFFFVGLDQRNGLQNHHQYSPDSNLDEDLLYQRIETNEDDSILKNKIDDSSWSVWSPWTPCSRLCDGGVTTSVRRCQSRKRCFGIDRRNKLCNMQPCTNKFDFRQIQCQAYNNKPYRDRYYEWQAFLDPTNPCSLTCQAKGLNFVAKLASHVIDGTRCTADSLAICVAGKCMNVGCDLQIGSTKKIDRCGVCGGDGTSCHNHSYSWSHRFYSNCSRRCGGGQQSSTVVCFDEINDLIVDDHYCTTNLKVKKPHHLVHDCNEFDCKPSWITEQWSNCSKSCGTGRQTRIAYCAIEQDDPSGSIKIKIDDHECDLVKKPEFERECRRNDCPQWFEGSWSECSVKCGEGRQQREVVCKDNQGFASDECDQALKPSTERKCFSNQNCFVNIYPQNDDQNDRSLTNSIGKRLLKIEPKSIPSYKIGEWSKCNVTCGLGHRSRNVSCRMYLEFSKTFAEIPMKECPGIEPLSIETCYGFDCDQQTNTTTTSTTFLPDEFGKGSEEYYWSVIGFTECSHECLGGIQDSIIECIKSENSMTMPSFYCDSKLKPPISYQICNDFPCTPRWNLSDFGKCSKECGEGGIQTRTVACIHEIIKEPSTTIIVDDSNCPSPKPSVKQKCNQIDCSAKWIADPWQKCSKPCDGGMKKRNVYCVKDFVHGGLQNVSLSDCHAKKPKVIKMCNLRPCRLVPNSEVVRKSKRNYFGSDHRSSSKQSFGKQTYKVQGKIVVHEGSRIRLICPEWSSNLNVRWFKGQEPISEEPSNRIIIAENVLKIRNINLKDIGVYKCIYSDDTENSMFLQVMPKKTMPISFFNKDELDDQINPTKPILDKTFSQTKSLNFIDDFSAMEFDRHSNSSWSEALSSKFNWISTGWSNCTIPCGGFGFKIRKSQCYAQTGNMTRLINDSYCLNSGLEKPKQFETCGLDSCYNWVVGNWSKCDDCVDLNKGLQKRSVICQSWNGSESNDSNCFQWVDKPIQQQECYLADCIPKLQSNFLCQKRTDEQCGRLISCVWQRNGKTIDDSFCDETIISDKK